MQDLIQTTQDKVLIFKVINSSTCNQMQDEVGAVFEIADVIQVEVINSEGNSCVNTTIIDKDGVFHSTLSPTVDSSVKNMQNVFGYVSGLVVEVVNKINNKTGRTFLSLDINEDDMKSN